ncbi:hypothetical protein E2C01_017237 [Portunus trituberculatus]|uniref:Uncharacterized protein n=1 Tax=Portunus trituberculatus TaxID=210409 RepID=A0A5B7DRT7_PORTR|nr:hypothetical protein [Portunus trituberculatus]
MTPCKSPCRPAIWTPACFHKRMTGTAAHHVNLASTCIHVSSLSRSPRRLRAKARTARPCLPACQLYWSDDGRLRSAMQHT